MEHDGIDIQDAELSHGDVIRILKYLSEMDGKRAQVDQETGPMHVNYSKTGDYHYAVVYYDIRGSAYDPLVLARAMETKSDIFNQAEDAKAACVYLYAPKTRRLGIYGLSISLQGKVLAVEALSTNAAIRHIETIHDSVKEQRPILYMFSEKPGMATADLVKALHMRKNEAPKDVIKDIRRNYEKAGMELIPPYYKKDTKIVKSIFSKLAKDMLKVAVEV